METATLEEQIELCKESAKGYLIMALLMEEAGNEESMNMYLKAEVKCFNKALELEYQLENINSYMAA